MKTALDWDGLGLPPEGAACSTTHEGKEMVVKVLAYGMHHRDACVLVADMAHGYESTMFGWIVGHCDFRALTPDQRKTQREAQRRMSRGLPV